jgi:hypothetical protein
MKLKTFGKLGHKFPVIKITGVSPKLRVTSKEGKNKEMKNGITTGSVSKTLMEFSRPLLNEMKPFLKNDDSDKKILETIFFVTTSVWDALVLDRIEGGNKYVTKLLLCAATGPDGLDRQVDMLIERKKKLFSEHMYTISDPNVRWENDQWILNATARKPKG